MADSNELHLVFGASGGLGNVVVPELAAQGNRLRGITRSGTADVPSGVGMVRRDAADPITTTSVCAGAMVVYDCAKTYTNWPAEFPPIMHGVIEGAAAAGAKLVFADNPCMYCPIDGPITEDLPNAAVGHKGRTRIHMTEMLMGAHEGRVRATIGASDFFGPGVTASALGDRISPAALAEKAAQVLGNPEAPHTFGYTPDCVRALITPGERDEAFGEILAFAKPRDEDDARSA